MDEPFSQVMAVHIEKIKTLLMKEKEYKGILITDHLYRDIIDICNNIYIIKNGKTYLTKSVQDIENFGYVRIKNN